MEPNEEEEKGVMDGGYTGTINGDMFGKKDSGWVCEWTGLFCPKDDGVEDGEIVNGPKECDVPAVPMSSCKSTCSTECTPSGVRIWIENNEIKIEECAICKPLHIDMCPNGTIFD